MHKMKIMTSNVLQTCNSLKKIVRTHFRELMRTGECNNNAEFNILKIRPSNSFKYTFRCRRRNGIYH